MNGKRLTVLLTTVVLMGAGPVMADGDYYPHGAGGYKGRPGQYGPDRSAAVPYARGYGPHKPHQEARTVVIRQGASQHVRHYRRGGKLPVHFRSGRNVVNDWHVHGLNKPPLHHHWVRVGGGYMLVGLETGKVLQVLTKSVARQAL